MKNSDKETAVHFAALDHHSVLELIRRLKADGELSEISKQGIEVVCVESFTGSNPAEAIKLILSLDALDDRESRLVGAFAKWAKVDPGGASQWFDEQVQQGGQTTGIPGLFQQAMIAQTRTDPDRALSRLVSPDPAVGPDHLARLGATIAVSLKNEREHFAFLAALRRKSGASPGSEVLRTVRADYMREFSNKLRDWTFDDATSLIDSEFLPDEKSSAAEAVSHVADLAEPARWATWLSKLNLPADSQHPLCGRIIGWAGSDPVAAGNWLEQMPAGDLRNLMIVQYSFQVANKDPVAASAWAMTLPDGKQRTKILRQIVEKWREREAPAAAAFAKEHGLTK